MFNGIELLKSFELFIFFFVGEKLSLGVDVFFEIVIICLCLNVIKGDIIVVIDIGLIIVLVVKLCIKVVFGCGGCVSLLKNVVDSEFVVCGVVINMDICEYFVYSC